MNKSLQYVGAVAYILVQKHKVTPSIMGGIKFCVTANMTIWCTFVAAVYIYVCFNDIYQYIIAQVFFFKSVIYNPQTGIWKCFLLPYSTEEDLMLSYGKYHEHE